jgi:hypothetical protein
MLHTGLAGVTYDKTILSDTNPIILTIPQYDEIFKCSDDLHPFFSYHSKPFNKCRYKYGGVLPLHIRQFNQTIPDNVTNVLRCPIKCANSCNIVLPIELEWLRGFVEFCCLYETSFNDKFDELFIHITVDRKNIVTNEYHRVQGFHVDGFQGHKFPVKHEIEHSYLWTSSFGTEFCPQPFFIEHIDESKFTIFDEMNKQAQENNIVSCLPNNIYMFDPYMVHRSPLITSQTDRTLVRMTCEYVKLLDPNDTQNPHLPFNIPVKYDVRNRFGTFQFDPNYEHYGFAKYRIT